jgi:hypothetical protein
VMITKEPDMTNTGIKLLKDLKEVEALVVE